MRCMVSEWEVAIGERHSPDNYNSLQLAGHPRE